MKSRKEKKEMTTAREEEIAATEEEIESEYLSSLVDLNVNSKPLINMLTMLAGDYYNKDKSKCKAHVIVRAVEKHLAKVFN